MRRPSPLAMAALGLALFASPSVFAQYVTTRPKAADPKDVIVDPTNPDTWNSYNTTAAQRRRMRKEMGNVVARVPLGVLTDAQAAEVRKQGPPRAWRDGQPSPTDAPGMAANATTPSNGTVPCASCAAAASGMPMMVAGPNGSMTMMNGDPNAAPPGYAIVGAPMPSAEPAPVGVMRTAYGMSPMATGSASAPGYASVGGPSAAMGAGTGAIPPAQNPVPPQALRRPHILAHVLGFSGADAGAEHHGSPQQPRPFAARGDRLRRRGDRHRASRLDGLRPMI